jgi:hypothetical protein
MGSPAESKILSDLVKVHTESATTTSLLLKGMADVMSTIASKLERIEAFMIEIKTTRENFNKYAVKIFIVVFFAQLAIIGMLLKELNVKGADAIKQVGTSGMQQAPK